MEVYTSSVSPKGQITLPIEIRRRFGVKTRDRIVIEVEGDLVRLRPARSAVDETYQAIPPLQSARPWAELEAEVKAEVALAAAREGLPQ